MDAPADTIALCLGTLAVSICIQFAVLLGTPRPDLHRQWKHTTARGGIPTQHRALMPLHVHAGRANAEVHRDVSDRYAASCATLARLFLAPAVTGWGGGDIALHSSTNKSWVDWIVALMKPSPQDWEVCHGPI